jgi:hypothetical protein
MQFWQSMRPLPLMHCLQGIFLVMAFRPVPAQCGHLDKASSLLLLIFTQLHRCPIKE